MMINKINEELKKLGDLQSKPILVPFTLFFAIIPPNDEVKQDDLTGTKTMMPLFKKEEGIDLIVTKILQPNSNE